MKILYVGPDYPGSNGTCWRDAFIELGHDVRTVDDERYYAAPASLPGKVVRKLRGRPAEARLRAANEMIVKESDRFRPDFTFYIKAYFVYPETLEHTRKTGPNFAYMNDDMFNPANQTYLFYEAIRRMDCIFTTKSYNVAEFHAADAPRAVYIPNAYDPKIHYPVRLNQQDGAELGGDVGFLGTYRPERADFLSCIANVRRNLRFNVWGDGWYKMGRITNLHRWPRWRNLKPCIRGSALWCEQMGKALQANKISLGLLYHKNRDLHTSRSFEIPACRGFMLGERTEEHRLYFEEDKEAVYFSSIEEMIDKIWFYTSHDSIRERIADAGYKRCMRSAATYADRARTALSEYAKMRPQFIAARHLISQ